MKNNLIVLILAAGRGKRLGGENQKVIRNLLGKPALVYLLDTVKKLDPERIILVVGFRKEEVRAELSGEPVEYVEQSVPRGTGDAVRCAQPALAGQHGDLLILCGDVPFLSYETMRTMIDIHRAEQAFGTLLTAEVADPTGYGRITRDERGNITGIVEEVNATPEQRRIREINAGVYVFHNNDLFSLLTEITPDPVKGEYYLTDVIKLGVASGRRFATHRTPVPDETLGINTFEDVERAELLLQRAKERP